MDARLTPKLAALIEQATEREQKTIKTRPYKLEGELQIIQAIGERLAPGFVIDGVNRPTIQALIAYFNGATGAFDPCKGVLLRGNIGTGKTLLFKIFHKYVQVVRPSRGFMYTTSRRIGEDYAREGYPGIDRYTYNIDTHTSGGKVSKPADLFIDDVGLERLSIKYFGTEVNIIAEILLTRYDLYTDKGILTYATTNLTPRELEDAYGDRIRSRLKQMFNDVVLEGKDRRGAL